MTAATITEIALVDLSSIAHPLWAVSGDQPDVDWTSRQIVERVRALTSRHPHAAICCDSGTSFRKDISPTYKANRPEREAALHHQIDLAREQLKADGYPVWATKGFEADDLIATAVSIARQVADTTVLIISADKDLLQLVGPTVRVMNAKSGVILDEAGVFEKFKVKPAQMGDYLTLVGDASDNVKGAKSIGDVRAATLLRLYGTLDNVYVNLTAHGTAFTPAMATALREFEPRLQETRRLIALRTDVDIPFLELDNPRVPTTAPMLEAEEMPDEVSAPVTREAFERAAKAEADLFASVMHQASAPKAAEAPAAGQPSVPNGADSGQSATEVFRQMAQAMSPAAALQLPAPPVVQGTVDVLAPAPEQFERQLEPRSLPQAMKLATEMYAARMFSGYGSGQAVLSTILAGRELGLPAIGSLRAFHIVEGRHMLSSDALRALVMKSGLAKYFRMVERTPELATFETWRVGDPEPVRLTFTIEEARQAGVVKPNSGWTKFPMDMLVARASSKLARLVYPDVGFGLYQTFGDGVMRADILGARFGRLTMTGAFVRVNGRKLYIARCDCGNQHAARLHHLRDGAISSCGCWHDEAARLVNTKHGHKPKGASTAEYRAWSNMLARCYRRSNKSFAYYGGRGIHVSYAWRHDFVAFLQHVGLRPSADHSIDRIDVDGHYEPGNVRWADRRTQARNVRYRPQITAFGVSRSLVEWSEATGMDRRKIHNRIHQLGWTAERAVSA